jgi:hypothetical protein
MRTRADGSTGRWSPKAARLRSTAQPDEHCDLYVQNLALGYYVKSVRIDDKEVGADGIDGGFAGPETTLEVTLSGRGAEIAGTTVDAEGDPAPGARVTLVPDPAVGRPQRYQTGSSDEQGGLPPARRRTRRLHAVRLYDDPPCEFYNLDTLPHCRPSGQKASVGSQTNVVLRVIAK